MRKNRLYAGASRTCITPGPEYFPMEHFNNHMTGKPSVLSGKIAEDIFLRVLVVQSGEERLVWAVVDLPGTPESPEVTQLIADCAKVDETHVIYTATHNHSGIYADNLVFERWYGEEFTRKVQKYRKFLREVIPGAVQKAVDSLRPARMGVEKGSCYLNVNRNEKELGPKAGTYGFRVDGPTDRDLYLLRFDGEDGKPIALLYNFAVHACMMIHNNPEGLRAEMTRLARPHRGTGVFCPTPRRFLFKIPSCRLRSANLHFCIDENSDMCYHDTDFFSFLRQNHENKLEFRQNGAFR